jgi:O-antigen/teichoic acid export membrane protein
VLILGIPISAAIAISAGPLVTFLYGSTYDGSAPVLTILGLCIVPMYVNIMLNQVLVAAKRQVAWTWVMGGATVINPLLNLVLIRATEAQYANGAIGAAASLLITEIAIISVGFVLVGRSIVDRAVVGRISVAVTASGAMCLVAWAARAAGPIPSLAAGGATFVVMAALLGLVQPDELAYVRSSVSRVVDRRLPALRRYRGGIVRAIARSRA